MRVEFRLDVPITEMEFLKKGFKRSNLVPFLRKERHRERHERRYVAAEKAIHEIDAWRGIKGVEIRVYNRGTKQLTMEFFKGKHRATWIPALAKLRFYTWAGPVQPKSYVLKCHDYEQLLFVLENYWLGYCNPCRLI
jgi:hypothetical protein